MAKYPIKTTIYVISQLLIFFLEKGVIYSSVGLDYSKILNTENFIDNNVNKYSLFSLVVYRGYRERGNYTDKYEKKDSWHYISVSSYKKIDPKEINDKNTII